jgi:phosphate transport system ATP-binding protein
VGDSAITAIGDFDSLDFEPSALCSIRKDSSVTDEKVIQATAFSPKNNVTNMPKDISDSSIMQLKNVSVTFSGKIAVRDISFDIPISQVTALIGPSGSGKTTLLRVLNRMHDTVRTARVTGSIFLAGIDIYGGTLHPTLVRSRVGMVFQRPNPFPTMSIYENVVSGLRFNGVRNKALLEDAAESALIAAALWDEVRDRLKASASTLSGGQQQRLCIARALAVEPEVLLMDEPTSALDPVATRRIEDLIGELKDRVTIVIVTHNMQQAARISDRCAFLLMAEDQAGELIEVGPTSEIFGSPRDSRTEDYVNGRFG